MCKMLNFNMCLQLDDVAELQKCSDKLVLIHETINDKRPIRECTDTAPYIKCTTMNSRRDKTKSDEKETKPRAAQAERKSRRRRRNVEPKDRYEMCS